MKNGILAACMMAVANAYDSPVPTIRLSEGVNMPMAMLGTWLYNDSVVHDAVVAAFENGYRGVDTAFLYENGKGIGQALKETGLQKDEYWITSKVSGGLTYNETISQIESQLADLDIPQIDLMLVHFPFFADGTPFSPEGRAEQWRAMEDMVYAGKLRTIGVSHFCKTHLQTLLQTARIRPVVNQDEYHIGMGMAGPEATDDKEYTQSLGMVYQPFSELCGPCCMGQDPDTCTLDKELLTGEMVTSIGAKYGKTGAQVSLKWLVQQGLPIIPKTSNPEHLRQNIDLWGWDLSDEDMATLTNSPSPPVCGGGDGVTSGDCGFEAVSPMLFTF